VENGRKVVPVTPRATKTEQPPQSRVRRALRVLQSIVRVAAPVALVVWLAMARPFDHVPPLGLGAITLIAGAAVLNLVYVGLKAWRWRAAIVDPPALWTCYWAQMEAFAANIVLGMGVADVVRSARLRPGQGAFLEDLGSSLGDKLVEYLSLAIVMVLAGTRGGLNAGVATIGACGVGAFALAWATRGVWLARLPERRWAVTVRAIAAVLDLRRLARMVTLGFVGWALEVVMLALCLDAFGLNDGDVAGLVGRAVLVLVGINVAIAIPGPPANAGTLESGAVLALVTTGVDAEQALAFSVAYHAMMVLPVAIAGGASFWLRSRSGHGGPR